MFKYEKGLIGNWDGEDANLNFLIIFALFSQKESLSLRLINSHPEALA